MELRELRSLIALHDTGSIREAASICNISPAAVHKHLKTLEGELGIRIYSKRDRSLRFTEPGLLALPFAKRILLEHDAAFTAIEEWKSGGRGLVRVGAGPSFSSYMLPALIKRFRRKHPHIDVYVETGDSNHLTSRLQSGALDLIFDLAAAALGNSSFEQAAEWEAQTAFISARADVPSHCRLRDLQKVPFILFGKDTLMGSIVQHYLDSLDFRPNVMMRSDSSEAIKAMIRAGIGISVLFLWNINADLRNSGFSVVRTDAPPLSVHMALIRSKSSYAPKAVTEFTQLASATTWKNLHLVKRRA